MKFVLCHKAACRRPRAFTLVEIIISIVILMVLVNGVLGYQYLSARDVKQAEVYSAGGRLATLMLESWKGCGGRNDFDPVHEFRDELEIHGSANGPAVPEGGFACYGSYRVRMHDIYFFVTLAKAGASAQQPMTLHATVTWRKDYSNTTLDGSEQAVRLSCYVID